MVEEEDAQKDDGDGVLQLAIWLKWIISKFVAVSLIVHVLFFMDSVSEGISRQVVLVTKRLDW